MTNTDALLLSPGDIVGIRGEVGEHKVIRVEHDRENNTVTVQTWGGYSQHERFRAVFAERVGKLRKRSAA